MIVTLTDETVNEYITEQAKIQGVTVDRLMEKLCRRVMELRLLESLADTVSADEWANKPIE